MNYRGYFKSLNNISYQVDIIADSSTTAYTEVIMGATPFVVNYNESTTPFDASRISTASISIVADEYLTSVVTSHAQGTIVRLTDLTNNAVKWVGYLKPNLYNQGYCNEYETIELEASDCLASLQYLKYETVSADTKSIVTIKNILDRICDKCGLLDGWEITKSKKTGNTFITPDMLKVSEQNFFSSDTDEAWKLSEVLDEICKYFGYTAVQWGNRLYLIDYQYFHNNNRLRQYYYLKSESYNTIHEHSLTTENSITASSYRGSNGDISFESIYNKAKVNCNFYEITDFIPDIFKDDDLTNRFGEKWQCKQILSVGAKNKYVNAKNKSTDEEIVDYKYQYYNRLYDNKHYESIYRNTNTLSAETPIYKVAVTPLTDSETTTGFTVSCKFTNHDNVSHTIYAYAAYMKDWWDAQTTSYKTYVNSGDTTITLSTGETQTISFTLPNEDTHTQHGTAQYLEGFTIDGTDKGSLRKGFNDPSTLYVGGTILDFATIERGIDTVSHQYENEYNYETPADINFKKYLAIKQADKPLTMHPASIPLSDVDSTFPCIFKLKSGYKVPIIVNNNSFLAIDANAIFTRYSFNYINPDWTTESTGIGGAYNVSKWGIISGINKVFTAPPALVLKLAIGDKYWNGSEWTSADTCFIVNMSTDVNDEGGIDYSNLWNSEHHVLNNISWEEWAGVKGYKIPLNSSLDFNNEILFEIHMPSKLQEYTGNQINNGFNGWCWIDKLNISIGTKGSELYSKTDCVYENVIDSDSINELNEITVKLTTYPDNGKMSFSNVQLGNNLLSTVKEDCISGAEQKPEENIIEKYVNQYSTMTKKETITTDMSFTPLQRIVDTYWNENFVMLGQQINYVNDNENITIIQIK